MRPRTVAILLTTLARAAAAARRRRRGVAVTVLAGLVLGGCSPAMTRPPVTQPELLALRTRDDEQATATGRTILGRLLERTKAEYDQYTAGRRPAPPVINILIISGGGDWGAFGAGFLQGWQQVPAQHPLAKPEFDAVTGVSTGTLIAPFAFLGDAQAIDEIVTLYRNPEPDWVKQRGILYFLPNNLSFAEVPGLEREMRKHITPAMLRRIAQAGADGRLLAVNTTDLDTGTSRVFDLVAEAQRAVAAGQVDRVHNIMLASAGIPGAFPFRMIDNELYVDGGVTGNIIYGGRIAEEDSLPAVWQHAYPTLPIPPIRYWVIFNNQLRPLPQVTAPTWPAVVARSLEMGTRAATVTAIRHLFTQADIAELKRGGEVEVRVIAVPNDFVPPKEGVFIKE